MMMMLIMILQYLFALNVVVYNKYDMTLTLYIIAHEAGLCVSSPAT